MAFIGNFGKKTGAGYSTEATKQFFGTEKPDFVLVSSSLQTFNRWDDANHEYTDQLDHTSVMVADEGIEPFAVKLPADADLDASFLDRVTFDQLETYQRGSRVYFRAQSVKVVK